MTAVEARVRARERNDAAEFNRNPETDSTAASHVAETRASESGSRAQAPAASESGSRAHAPASAEPREEQLLDVLYEVLAHGAPERSSVTREQIEQLLHEHARQPKPLEEFVRFFERHALPFDASAYGADDELGELASGLLRQRSLLDAFAGPEELPALPVQAPAFAGVPAFQVPHGVESEPTGRHQLEARAGAGERNAAADWVAMEQTERTAASLVRLRKLAWAGACAAFALLAAFSYSQWQAATLERKLEQARMQQLSTDAALSKLEQRAERLSGELRQSEDDRRGLNAHFDAILKEETHKRASEEETLERLLGGRYRKLRQKLAEEAAVAAP